ncbi:MAG TPA: polysaccharide deacetylase family protein [Syntrophales bacterium]|nr:polysaccharide deacetylase family protein [Syntrophales bacterium]
MECRKLQIVITLFIACLFLSNCWAEELKANVKKPPYHIYLSFDDGPLEGSEDIDDAVRVEKIKIDVFLVGSYVREIPRMYNYFQLYENNPNIEIGNHSYSHAHDEYRLFYQDPESVYQDFIKNERMLHLKSKLARLPGRNMWRIGSRTINDVISGSVAADLLSQNGYLIFGWDLEWQHDARTGVPIQTVNDIFKQIESLLNKRGTITENHIVILCHDEMFRKNWEETELKQLIERLRSTGLYEFNHLSEYPRQ